MRKHKIAIAAVVLLIVAYLVQTLVIPPDAAALSKYRLTTSSARLLSLTFIIPLISVWCIALYGYLRFSTYASSIKDTPDGAAFNALSDGVLALALWLPSYTVIQNASTSLWHRYPSITEGVVITTNLIYVCILLVVADLLWRGSRMLLQACNISHRSINRLYVYTTTAAFAVLISYLVLLNPSRNATAESGATAFYLPNWLLVLCIIIPYILVWYAGLEVLQNIHTYQTKVKGIVYRQALSWIAYGIAFSVIAALTLRTLSTLTAWLDDLALKFLLLVLYALVILFGVGYSLLTFGAKKLQLIEKV